MHLSLPIWNVDLVVSWYLLHQVRCEVFSALFLYFFSTVSYFLYWFSHFFYLFITDIYWRHQVGCERETPFLVFFCIDFLLFVLVFLHWYFFPSFLIFTGGIKCVVRERHMRPRGVIGSHALSLNQSDFFCICFYFSSHPFPIFWHWFSHFLTVYHSLLSLFPIWHNPACFCYCMFHIPINPNQSERISGERRPFAGRRAIEYKSCSQQCPQHYLNIQIY